MTSPDTESTSEDAMMGEEDESLDAVSAGEAESSGPVLTDAFTDEELEEMGQEIMSDFDADCESCEPYLKDCAKWNKLYESIVERKTFPFDKAATVNVPVLTIAVLQIHGRLFDMVNPAKGNMYHAVPLHQDPQELERSNRTEMQANYWARHQCIEYNSTLEMLTWRCALYGSSFSEMDWDDDEGRPTYDCVPVEDMVVPWSARSNRPDMKDVPRYTRVKRMSFWEVSSQMDSGFFRSVPDIIPTSEDTDDSSMSQVRERLSGLQKSGEDASPKDSLRKVLVHYRKCTLPDDPTRQEHFDGKAHAVRVWLDHETGKVLRVTLREEPDPRDAERFNREQQAYAQYVAAMASYEASGGYTIDPATGMQAPLAMPQPVEESKPQRIRTITFNTHYKAFPSEGFYGLGYGKIVGPLNEALNSMFNQRIDLATVNNAGGGYKSRLLRFPSGQIMHQPGQWVDVDAPPSALREGLVPRPIITGDPAMPQFLEMMEGWVQRSTGSGDTLSGEPSKSNETATAATARYDAAVKQISVLASRIVQTYMRNDANMLWRLYATYLPDEEYSHIVDEQGGPQTIRLARQDFEVEGRVYPVADPRVMTKQDRVQAAQAFLQFAGTHPMLAQNQQIQFWAIRNYLTAMDMQEVMGMLQPPAPPPPKPQTEENADFLRGQQPKVNPQDNDDEHLANMAAFRTSPEFIAMTPEMQKVYEQHGREHMAAKMTKEAKSGQAQAMQGVPGLDAVGGNPGTGLMSM